MEATDPTPRQTAISQGSYGRSRRDPFHPTAEMKWQRVSIFEDAVYVVGGEDRSVEFSGLVSSMTIGDADPDTLRVLISTDTHLGFMEKDEIRGSDSFNAFDEICSIAIEQQVDFVLFGGDLFHENKPSRSTLVRTIEILRRYCLSDRPVQFEVVSDQSVNFPNKFGLVNYEDPNFKVGLPVFIIHGNHDDPAGVDNLSSLDILSASNLLNYFGKVGLSGSGVGQITLHPILIRKGATNVALYGLGNIRDERLNRMFQTPHAVEWIRPEKQEDSDWFNIFVLHQNRVKSNPKNAINESFLAGFLDFVIWGHEHECLVEPQEVAGMGFHITQPGSSVATALTDGEAKPKHVLLVEIKGNQYRPTKIPLQSVRPFEFTEVSLKDDPDLDPNDPVQVAEFLGNVVQESIARASAKVVKTELMMPLVRIKVDYTGYSTINPQRFGQKFVGKVANPHDILLFTKQAKKRQTVQEKQDKEMLPPEELNQQNIEALLAESNLKMEILPVNDLAMALHDFVNKDDKQAFVSCVQQTLEDTRTKLVEDGSQDLLEEPNLVAKISEHMVRREADREARKITGAGPSTSGRTEASAGRQTAAGRGRSARSSQLTADDDDDDFGADPTPAPSAPGRGRRPSSRGVAATLRGRGRGGRASKQTTLDFAPRARPSQRAASAAARSAMQELSDDEHGDEGASDDDEALKDVEQVEDSEEEIPESPKASRGKKRAAPARGRGRGSSASTPAKRGRKAGAARSSYIDDDVDEDDEDAPPAASKVPARRNWGSIRK